MGLLIIYYMFGLLIMIYGFIILSYMFIFHSFSDSLHLGTLIPFKVIICLIEFLHKGGTSRLLNQGQCQIFLKSSFHFIHTLPFSCGLFIQILRESLNCASVFKECFLLLHVWNIKYIMYIGGPHWGHALLNFLEFRVPYLTQLFVNLIISLVFDIHKAWNVCANNLHTMSVVIFSALNLPWNGFMKSSDIFSINLEESAAISWQKWSLESVNKSISTSIIRIHCNQIGPL